MNELHYTLKSNLTPRTEQLLVEGYPIKIGDVVYEKLSSKPSHRRVVQTLLSQETDTKITIYS